MTRTVRRVRRAALRGALMAGATAILHVISLTVVYGQTSRAGEALARLKAGNARFVADAAEALPITAPRRAALAQGQSPYASVLSCADSRVPPEVIFHTGLGDLFVVRAAGHVADRSVLASIEYGAEHLHTPLIVVMGHESCGAVKAAIETPATKSMGPNLDYLLQSIRPAVARTSGQATDTRLRAAILANVEETINRLLEDSAVLKRMAETQQLVFVGAFYELSIGRVHFSEPVGVIPRAKTLSSAAAPKPLPSVAPAPKPQSSATTAPKPAASPTSTSTAAPPVKAASVPTSTSKPAGH